MLLVTELVKTTKIWQIHRQGDENSTTTKKRVLKLYQIQEMHFLISTLILFQSHYFALKFSFIDLYRSNAGLWMLRNFCLIKKRFYRLSEIERVKVKTLKTFVFRVYLLLFFLLEDLQSLTAFLMIVVF